jgi:hypothetical protein
MKFNLNIHVQADDKTTILACLIGRTATRSLYTGRWICFNKDGKALTTSNDNWENLDL